MNSSNDRVSLDGLPTAEAKSDHHRLAGGKRPGPEDGDDPAPRLAVQPPALLGRAVPRRDRRARPRPRRARIRIARPAARPRRLPALGSPRAALGKATDWVRYSETLRRETNTMPQWAGSCWYFLRYIDPKNDRQPWDPDLERYWMPVDLYVGAPSMRSCTCSTAGSGTKSCSTGVTSARPSRSTSWSTRG